MWVREMIFLNNNKKLFYRMPFETTSSICSIVMGGILEKYPKLRIVFAHGMLIDR